MCFHFKSDGSKRMTQMISKSICFVLPGSVNSSLTLSLTLLRDLFSVFLHCGAERTQLSSSLALALIFNTSPGMGYYLSRHLHWCFLLSFILFFSYLNLHLGRLTRSEGNPRCLTASWAAFKAVRTVFKNASSASSLWGALNTLESISSFQRWY